MSQCVLLISWRQVNAQTMTPPKYAGFNFDQGKEVTQFQLTIGYSRPDTSMLHRVPLSLSVK